MFIGVLLRFFFCYLLDDGDEFEGVIYDDYKFEMLGLGCVRGGFINED